MAHAAFSKKIRNKRLVVPVALGAFVLGYILLNAPYFLKNGAYLWHRLFEKKEESPLPAEILQYRESNTLYIDALSIEAPIMYITEKNETAYQDALQHGVVHYPGTALPGQLGNVYIFGHSSDLIWAKGDYKTIFATLPSIENGAIIEITDETGLVYSYAVQETKVVSPKDLSVLDQFNHERKMLSVQTSYPIGTALQRFVVVAELVENE